MYAIAIAIVLFAGRPLLRNRGPTRTAFTCQPEQRWDPRFRLGGFSAIWNERWKLSTLRTSTSCRSTLR